MEVGNQPAPMMRIPTSFHAVPGVRICSERHCSAILSRHCKGNLCEQCVLKIRSRRSSTKLQNPTKEGVPAYNIPVSTADHPVYNAMDQMSAKNLKRRPSSVQAYMAASHGGIVNVFAYDNPQYDLHQSSVPDPQSLCMPPSVASGTPIVNHFNPQGEVIQDVYQQIHREQDVLSRQNLEHDQISSSPCLRCLRSIPWHRGEGLCPDCRVELAIPPSLTPTVGTDGAIFSSTNVDNAPAVNMEPSYPLTSSREKMLLDEMKNQSLSRSRAKRRKVFHPDVMDPIPPEEAPSSSARLPKHSASSKTSPSISPEVRFEDLGQDVKFMKASIPCLKLCSTSDCTGIIPADSSAVRCLLCVQRDWKSKRLALSFQGANEGDTTNSAESLDPARTLKRKKVVTWADEVAPRAIVGQELLEAGAGVSVSIVPRPGKLFSSPDDPLKTGLQTQYPIGQIVNGSEVILRSSSDGSKLSVCMEQDELEDRISDPEASRAPQHKLAGEIFGDHTDISDRFSGWDSDLSELSSSSEQSSEDTAFTSESSGLESPRVPCSSGFTIRIPARPAGLYSRKCMSPKCDQLLSSTYRWKSCVMCRARNRNYQRRRQNLQGRHRRLDEELLRTQTLGRSTSPSNDVMDFDEDVVLTPGARLCAVRDCTFIIPPHIEYRWKMCTICRFQKQARKERDNNDDHLSRLDDFRGQSSKASGVTDSVLLLKLLPHESRIQDRYRKRGEEHNDGRCQSIDCGMLIVDPSSLNCRQCLARRSSIMDDNQNRSSMGTIRKKPASYTQYKCFSAFLSEFKERLSGFLQSQSVFFLFKRPKAGKALFAFDGEYSVVALDFDVVGRRDEIEAKILQLKHEIEYICRLKFSPKRLVSVLDEGLAVRFSSIYTVPILRSARHADHTSISTIAKNMQCEMEIAVAPDRSHRFVPGQRTAIRFRLFG